MKVTLKSALDFVWQGDLDGWWLRVCASDSGACHTYDQHATDIELLRVSIEKYMRAER